jgi:hypothetical protein
MTTTKKTKKAAPKTAEPQAASSTENETPILFPDVYLDEGWFEDGKLVKLKRNDFSKDVDGAQQFAAYQMYRWMRYYHAAPERANPESRKLAAKRRSLEKAQAKLAQLNEEIAALEAATK